MKVTLIYLTLFSLFIAGARSGLMELKRQAILEPAGDEKSEVLYLPSGHGLELISFGYRNVLADVLWFRTVNYFGKHYASDQSYKWLFHMCQLVTKLDPEALHVYEFGAMMLAWEAHQPEQSLALMDLAISEHPNYWRFYYLRGFTNLLFMGQTELATEDFKAAASLPDAPVFLASLAAKKMTRSLNDPEAAVQFLTEMLRNSNDPTSRSILERRLEEARKRLQP